MDLPTREQVQERFEAWPDLDVDWPEIPVALAYCDGVLKTREEFVEGLDFEAAAKPLHHWLRLHNPDWDDDQYVVIAKQVLMAGTKSHTHDWGEIQYAQFGTPYRRCECRTVTLDLEGKDNRATWMGRTPE